MKSLQFGTSYEGREMSIVHISNFENMKENKPIILIDAGIHAREWLAIAFALYIISQLVENSEENMNLLNSYEVLIIPVLNPDGYEYTHTHVSQSQTSFTKLIMNRLQMFREAILCSDHFEFKFPPFCGRGASDGGELGLVFFVWCFWLGLVSAILCFW